MRKLIAVAFATVAVAASASASGLSGDTAFNAGRVVVPAAGAFTDVGGARVLLTNANARPQGNGLVLFDFDAYRVHDAAGAIVSRGGPSRAIASQHATGGINTVLVAPPADPTTAECVLDLDHYDQCLDLFIADPNVYCEDIDCQSVSDMCESESWSGDC